MQDNESSGTEQESKPMTGLEVLRRAWQMQDGYEALTLKLLHAGQLGVRASPVFEGLARSFLLLTEAGSCHWGCRGGDHTVEKLLGRFTNYAFGAIRLACIGLYDEALAPVRSMAEIGNLLQLFSLSNGHLAAWRQADLRQKRNNFMPVRVRKQIEKAGHRPIVGQDTYARLCEMGIHVSPTSIDNSHDLSGRQYMGGNFSPPGFLLVMSQMAHIIAPVLELIGRLIDAPLHKRQELGETRQELQEAVGQISVDNYQEFFDDVRAKQRKELVQQELSRLADGEFQTIKQAAFEELISCGELPADHNITLEEVGITLEEVQDKLFTQICKKLPQEAQRRQQQEESDWLKQNAEVARVEDILRQAAMYKRGQTQNSEEV